MVTDFVVDDAQRLGVLGGDDDAAGVAVDTVAQSRGKGIFPPGIPLPLLVEVCLDVIDEGVHLLRLVSVDYQPRTLIQQHQVLILIHNVKAGLKEGEEHIFLPRLVEKLIVNIQLQHVPLGQPLIPGSPLAVDLDALYSNVFLQQSRGQQGQGLPHEPIQPLPGVIFSHGKLTHLLSPSGSIGLL